MNRPAFLLAMFTTVFTTGCVLAEVNLEGRRCPCGEGFGCDTNRGVCVRGGFDAGNGFDAGDGRSDAGPDSGLDGGFDATVDAPIDAGPSSSICDEVTDAIFCDGFEGPSLGGWRTRDERSGTVEATASGAFRGNGALRATTTGSGGVASVSHVFSSPVTDGSLYLRAWVFVPSTVDSQDISLLFLGEDAPPRRGLGVQLADDERMDVFIGPEGPEGRLAGGVRIQPDRDRWVCMSLRVTVGDAGAVALNVDGVTGQNEGGVDTLPASGIDRVTVGIEYSDPAQIEAEVFVDDVTVSRIPLPCDP